MYSQDALYIEHWNDSIRSANLDRASLFFLVHVVDRTFSIWLNLPRVTERNLNPRNGWIDIWSIDIKSCLENQYCFLPKMDPSHIGSYLATFSYPLHPLRLCILVQTIHTIKILLFTFKTVQCFKCMWWFLTKKCLDLGNHSPKEKKNPHLDD